MDTKVLISVKKKTLKDQNFFRKQRLGRASEGNMADCIRCVIAQDIWSLACETQ